MIERLPELGPYQPIGAMRLAQPAILLALSLALTACSDRVVNPALSVILIVIDDMGWTDAGIFGSSFYETPAIDRLAAEGVRFTQFYTASPVCSPTRASLMTGKHPARLDLTNWIGGEENGLLIQADYVRRLPLEEVTVGEAFREAGYKTGYVGKWHLGEEPNLPEKHGFDFNFGVNQTGQPGSYFAPYENPAFAASNVPDLEGDPGEAYLTDRLTDVTLAFLDRYRDEPFFFVLSHYAVHTPLQSRPEKSAPYEAKAAGLGTSTDEYFQKERDAVTKLRQDHAVYAGMIASVDESVGRILDKLVELGIDDQTAVVFLSDNGGLSTRMGGSNQATANVGLRAGKGWLYEGGIRTPLIVKWPGRTPRGAIVDIPTMSTDIYPTLLEMAGLPSRPEQHVDGVSLAGVLLGSAEAPCRDLHWHFPHYHNYSGNRPGGAIRVGNLKLVEWFEGSSYELYDLAADPGEREDLTDRRPEEAARLIQLLREWRQEVGANMPKSRQPS